MRSFSKVAMYATHLYTYEKLRSESDEYTRKEQQIKNKNENKK